MKIIFNELGAVIETITDDESYRQGNIGNTLTAIFENKNANNYIALITFTRSDGSMIQRIPMEYLNESSYKYQFNEPWFFELDGATTLTVYLHDSSGNVIANGQLTFNIEKSDYNDITDVTLDEFNELISLIANKVDLNSNIFLRYEENINNIDFNSIPDKGIIATKKDSYIEFFQKLNNRLVDITSFIFQTITGDSIRDNLFFNYYNKFYYGLIIKDSNALNLEGPYIGWRVTNDDIYILNKNKLLKVNNEFTKAESTIVENEEGIVNLNKAFVNSLFKNKFETENDNEILARNEIKDEFVSRNKTASKNGLYGYNNISEEKNYDLDYDNVASSVIIRDENGNAGISEPKEESHISNKGYVDKTKDELQTEINELKSLVYETVIGEENYTFKKLYNTNIPNAINTYPIIASAGCEVSKIEGNTIVWNQLQQIATSSITKTVNGITMTDNRDGSYTLNGTATEDTLIRFPERTPLEIGHKYLIKGCPSGGSNETYFINDGWNSSSVRDYGEGAIYEYKILLKGFLLIMTVKAGTTLNNLVARPQVFDLTRMFGVGYEPTIEEFNRLFSDDYYAYNEAEIISSNIGKIESYDKNGKLLKSQYLSGQIIGINMLGTPQYHNTYSFEEQEDGTYNLIKITKIASVDLGSLTWTAFGNGAWKAILPIKPLNEVTAFSKAVPWLSTKYAFRPASDLESDTPTDKSICEDGGRIGLMVYDSDYAEVTPEVFKTAMAGIIVIYPIYNQSKETIDTGLSDVSLNIEKGGILKADNRTIIAPNVEIKFAISKIKEEERNV